MRFVFDVNHRVGLKVATLIFYAILMTGCGGGGSANDASTTLSNNMPSTLANNNIAWNYARVYKPFSKTPVSIAELQNVTESPVAISLHGCDGVNNTSDPSYYPILLASFGYLVIEPDSYPGDVAGSPGSFLCQGFTIPQAATINLPNRALDAAFAVAKVRGSSFWDKKNLLVQGQSQGAVVLSLFPNLEGATKILWTGYNCRNASTGTDAAKWLPGIPKLVVNSADDPWGAGSNRCASQNNWQIEIIPGSEHNPQRTALGLDLIANFVKIK